MKYPQILFAFSLSILLSACGGAKKEEAKGRKASGCSSINARVYGGESCKKSVRAPVVKLFMSNKNGQMSVCSGTLVTLDDILTSAHCLIDGVDEVVALIGGEKGEWIPVVDLQIHPKFGFAPGDPYDLAMLTLRKIPSPVVAPLPIGEKKKTKKGELATAFGYGLNEQKEQYLLKSVDVKIEEKSDGNIFAKKKTSNGSICGGDSGGPLTQNSDGQTVLIGVSSFGDGLSDCQREGASFSGFVDIQRRDVMKFIKDYAPDAAVY